MIIKNRIYSPDGFCKLLGISPIIRQFVDHCEFLEYLSRELPYERFIQYDLNDEDFLNEWGPDSLYIPVRAYSNHSNHIRVETKYYTIPERLKYLVMNNDNTNKDLILLMGRCNCKSMMADKILNKMSKLDRSCANTLMDYSAWRMSCGYKDTDDPIVVDNLPPSTVVLKTDDTYGKMIMDTINEIQAKRREIEIQEIRREEIKAMFKEDEKMQIKDVKFNPPATIVWWNDGSKTVVKAINEPFDKEKGLAMAYVKKCCGNLGNYNNIFRKWCKEESND